MAALTYRAAGLEDAELASDLMAAANPAINSDPVMTRYRWENPRRGYTSARFIAALDSRPVAFVAWIHGPWEKLPDRHCEIEVWLDRARLERDLLIALWAWIEDSAIGDGARLILAYAGEDETLMLETLVERGFARDRLDRVSALDLKVHGPRLLELADGAQRAMNAKGVSFTTLDAWERPEKLRLLYELDSRSRHFIPHSLPILTETLDDFERRTAAPDRRADRTWIAVERNLPVAMSYMKFPPVRGIVWTGYTCTDPDQRGRGLARAVKLMSLAQAIRAGVLVVRTDNDAENLPMLHINQELGYEQQPGFVGHLKRVQEKGDG